MSGESVPRASIDAVWMNHSCNNTCLFTVAAQLYIISATLQFLNLGGICNFADTLNQDYTCGHFNIYVNSYISYAEANPSPIPLPLHIDAYL